MTLSVDVYEAIRAFAASMENSLRNGTGEPAWETPLVGYANGADAEIARFKQAVGAEHWSPEEALQLAFPDSETAAEDISVISWVLPQTGATRADQRHEDTYPCERWARSRVYGEEFNDALRRHLLSLFKREGIEAVAPSILPEWTCMKSEAYDVIPSWSERHYAYAAGLGTFGLSDGLITAAGKAVRFGSVVAGYRIDATPRPYTEHHAYCLHYAKGTCGACVRRCPAGSVLKEGRNKDACRQYLAKTRVYVPENYGFPGYGCGLCQTKVPCEKGIPAAIHV